MNLRVLRCLPVDCRTPVADPTNGRRSFQVGRPAATAPIRIASRGVATAPGPGPVASAREASPILERVAQTIAARHYSRRTERAYVGWVRRFIAFHHGRDVAEMGEAEVTHFLTTLVTRGQVTASTQNQALSALLFLYRDVLGRELHGLDAVRAKPSLRLPVVLSREEVSSVLRHLHGSPWLMMSLMYGAGLRLLECARLRVKDLDFDRGEITVRDGKGRKDRVSLLPAKLAPPL